MAKRQKSTFLTWLRAIIIALAIVSGTYSIGDANVLNAQFSINFNWDSASQTSNMSLLTGAFFFGTLFGPFLSSLMLDSIGRYWSLMIICSINLFANLCGLIINFYLLVIARCVLGACLGILFSLVPIYVSEMTPVHMRGAAGSLTAIAVTTGLLCSYIMGIIFTFPCDTSSWDWRFVFIVPAAFNALQLILLPIIIKMDSPTFYMVYKSDEVKARQSTSLIYTDEFVEYELDELRRQLEIKKASLSSTNSKSEEIKNLWRQYKFQFLLGLILTSIQQLGGISAINSYSNKILENAGLSTHDATIYTTISGAAGIIGALIPIPIIDFVGRKILFLFGLTLITLIHTIMSIALYTNAYEMVQYLIIAFVLIYSMSVGSIPFLYLPEILPSLGVAIAIFFNSLSSFAVVYSFLFLSESAIEIGGVFAMYAIFCLLALIFCIIYMPETKGKTLLEVSLIFQKMSEKASLVN